MANDQVDANAEEHCVRVEINLSPQVESFLSRHGRRHFRDLQAATAAKLRLDRARSVLKVCGTDSEVESIQRQLECLSGVRKVIPTAVWCELMRTRLEEDPERSILQKLQLQSGCRIHVERSELEVRIFGTEEGTQIGIRLLEELAQSCKEIAIPVERGVIPTDVLQEIAEACHVGLNLEEDQVVVYGLAEATAEAAKRVREQAEEAADELATSADTDDELAIIDDDSSSTCSGSWYDGEVCGEGDITPRGSEVGEVHPDFGCLSADADTCCTAPQPPQEVLNSTPDVSESSAQLVQGFALPSTECDGSEMMLAQSLPMQAPCQWMVVGTFPQVAEAGQPCHSNMQPYQALYRPASNMTLPMPTTVLASELTMPVLEVEN